MESVVRENNNMIIKNCPAYYNNLGCMSNKMFYRDCEKEDNCIMKQLVNEYPEIKNMLIIEE